MTEKILEWAAARSLLNPDNASKQMVKLMEEVGELSSALLKSNKPEQEDAIGDIQVVLIILSAQLGIDYKASLESAYEVIKNRKGKTVDGTFIKEDAV
mgnify:CR=1 FL=1